LAAQSVGLIESSTSGLIPREAKPQALTFTSNASSQVCDIAFAQTESQYERVHADQFRVPA